ncbi:ankyrin repeat domain-containing protein [Flavobacterium sp.]|uniref:ankyrin repeat domain-containing protein n=1 Tax=Flavobacterium sp. TaxID=239 RepID=UPI003D0D8B99
MKIVNLFFLVILFHCATTVFAQEVKIKDVFDIARSGTVEDLIQLEKTNANVADEINTMGFNPLILACYKGNNDVALYLMKKTKNINFKSSNGTALAAATVKGNLTLVHKLLESGAQPDISDDNGVTPLHYAIQFKNVAMVKLLLSFKADKYKPDGSGKKPFEYAVFSKNEEIINLLKN